MLKFMSARWERRRSVVFLLASTLAASLLTALGASVPAQAAITDRPAITWNMQGAATDGQSKWYLGVGNRLIGNGQPVVALQEVGAPPQAPNNLMPVRYTFGGANLLAALPPSLSIGDLPNITAARTVLHSQWAYGRSGILHDVYYLQTDANNGAWAGGRVNLAIVTPRGADEVAIVPTPGGAGSNGAVRPALGVRLGNTWYFSIHASANGGTNAQGLLDNIQAFVNFHDGDVTGGEEAIVLGDYNRAPTALTIRPTWRVVATGAATQNGGGQLDYGVVIEPAGRALPQGLTATSQNIGFSDHDPVTIRLAALPTPTSSAVPVYPTPRVIENVQAGGVLDVFQQQTANGSSVDSFARNGQSNQSWTVLGNSDGSLEFQGIGSGRCIQENGQGISPQVFDCTDAPNQRWTPVYLGNGEMELETAAVSGLCLSLNVTQTDPAVGTPLRLSGCANVPAERFFITAAAPSATPIIGFDTMNYFTALGPTTLENTFNGGAMDVQNNATASGTEVISWSRNQASNQAWDIIPNSGGTVSFESVSSRLCLDIHNSNTATLGRDLVIFACTGQGSQQFVPIALTDGQWEFKSDLTAVNGACIGTANATASTPRSGFEAVNTCTGSGTQEFNLTPYDPTGTPTLPGDGDTTGIPHTELYSQANVPTAPVPAQRVGYYTSWSTYANAFYPKALDTEGIARKLTVLDYAFENIDPVNLTCFAANKAASTDPNTTTGNDGSSDAYADYQKEYAAADSVNGVADVWNQPLRGNFNQLKELKAKYPNLKILLSIGGWTYSKFFSDVAATDASRKKFVSSCINLYIKGNLPQLSPDPAGGTGSAAGIFDGFDIDWEFPGSPDGHPGNHYSAQDGANYTLLLNEFRTELNALGGEHYMLTAALPAGPTEIANLNIPSVASALDLGDVEGYDFHGAFETTGPTNFQAPLYDTPASPAFGTKFTVADAVGTYLNGGFPASKLTLGVPFYGRGWTGVPDGGQHGLYQTVTGATAAFPDSQQAGVADYKELEAAGKLNNLYYDPASESTWEYDGTNFWSIETPLTLALKRQYIQQMGLGGIMMYSLEADDANTTLVNAATGMS